jgi:Tetratricopeptide repeat/Cytochrome c554 and c-prime
MSVRKADVVCGKCHVRIYTDYLRTHMANASGAAVEGLETGSFRHAASGIEYRMFEEDGAAWLSYERAGRPPLQGRQKLVYFMGSGNHGRTYLYSLNGYWFETPIAYYARKRGYDMRPAYLNDKEMPFNLPMNVSCLRCHVSDARLEDVGTRNHYAGAPFLYGGITCEACHGGSRDHILSGGSRAIVNPAKLDAERRDSVCISCHLEGDAAVPRNGKTLVNYRPGEKISDYVTYFVRSEAGATSRAVSQVEALNLSRCKQASGSRMSCMSCHDPHRPVSSGERAAFYRSKCLMCHVESKYANAHFPDNPDCTSCHMPKGAPSDIPHEQWTDHRIRRTPGLELRSSAPNEEALIPVPGVAQQASGRDLALAYYNVVSDGDLSLSDQARDLLARAARSNPDDAEVWKALGVLAQMRNDRTQAAEYYRKTLAKEPADYTAGLNLGVLLARGGELAGAIELWRRLFSRNEDITELGMNLAAAECISGDKPAAKDTLVRVLLYSPDHQRARTELSEIESGQATCPPH